MSINEINDINSAKIYIIEKLGFTGDNDKDARSLVNNALMAAQQIIRESPNSYLSKDCIDWLFFNTSLTKEEKEKISSIIS